MLLDKRNKNLKDDLMETSKNYKAALKPPLRIINFFIMVVILELLVNLKKNNKKLAYKEREVKPHIKIKREFLGSLADSRCSNWLIDKCACPIKVSWLMSLSPVNDLTNLGSVFVFYLPPFIDLEFKFSTLRFYFI